ncbi:MAG: inositol monophosphatase [Acidobacteria bacterium]|nr:MAG: inositol monophosphatase [Acidobacteriota bacterium]PYY08378.1 MAG: inositol monophosphatase [Acidobacteriota bacterium]
MPSNTDSSEFVPAMAEIAREAGALLIKYFEARVKIEYKGEVDLVTEADRKSEALILERIRAQWPNHDVMGEEGTRIESGSDYRWYVDPLDGTTNFAHGFPVFCVSLALEFKGQRIAGVVYDPTRNELFSAEQGRGAYLNNRPIRVSAVDNLAECLVATGFPSHKRHKNPNVFFYHQITLRTHGVRRAGSAALDLCSVACGRFDAFWEFNLNPWDTAAGVLIVEEAGGQVSDFSGAPFNINSRETLASNSLVHEAMLAEFDAVFKGRGLEELPSPVEYAKSRGKAIK